MMEKFEVSEMLSEKGKSMLVIDNYKYNFHKMLAGNIKRWQCIQRGCKAFVKTLNISNSVVEYSDNHNHGSLPETMLNRQKLSNGVKRKAMEDLCEKPLKLIHSEIKRTGTETLTVEDVHLIRKNIYNGRKQVLPKIPKCLQEVHDSLNCVEVATNQKEQFLLRNDAVKKVVAFSCASNLTFLSKLETIYVDGTFKYCTKFFNQLFTVHGLENGHYVPLAFFLLSNKFVDSYATALNCLKAECQKLNLNFNPRIVYADFERAIHAAIIQVFPYAKIKGCRFHLGQSWWRKIQKIGLAAEYSKDNDVGQYLRYIFGLPFLNPTDVGECFAIDFGEILPAEHQAVQQFADYLVDNYISEEADFPPEMWAENSSSLQRTTNACESFHSKFNSLFYNPHPNIFQFLEVLKNIQIDTYIKIRSSSQPKKVYRRALQERQQFVNRKIEQLRQNEISRLEFVKYMSYKFMPK